MITGQNIVNLTGGVVRDPEYLEGPGLLKLSIGVDNAGREDGKTASGFFDINIWTKPSKFSAEAVGEDALKAFEQGDLGKGTRVQVVGRLMHDRFETKDGSKASRINIVAEGFTVLYSKNRAERSASNRDNGSSNKSSGGAEPKGYAAGGNDYDDLEPF